MGAANLDGPTVCFGMLDVRLDLGLAVPASSHEICRIWKKR